MNDREVNPKKYIAPKNWYKYGSEMVRPYKIRIHPPCAKDEKKLRGYYESKLAALPDVMDAAAAVDFIVLALSRPSAIVLGIVASFAFQHIFVRFADKVSQSG